MLTKLLLLVARRPIMEGLVCKLVDCFVFNKDLVNNCQLLFSPFLQQKKVYHRQREDTYGVGDGAWQNIWVKMSFKRLISLQYFLWQRWEKEMGWVKMRNPQHFAPTILYSRLFPKNTFFDIVFVVFLFCIYFVFFICTFSAFTNDRFWSLVFFFSSFTNKYQLSFLQRLLAALKIEKKQTRSAPHDLKYHVALVCWPASAASLMVKLCRSHRLWASLRHNIKPPFFWALSLSLSHLYFYSQIFHVRLNRVVVVQCQVFTNSVTTTLCSITVLQM